MAEEKKVTINVAGGWTIGSVIAIIVLILALLLMILGRMPVLEGGLFAALALARLV